MDLKEDRVYCVFVTQYSLAQTWSSKGIACFAGVAPGRANTPISCDPCNLSNLT
jgi:hypothetical protein